MNVHQQRLDNAVRFLDRAIKNKEIPGAVTWVHYQGETVLEKAVGYAHDRLQIPMEEHTIFDLASLTKVCATLPSIMILLESGEICLDDPVSHHLPQFQNGSKEIKIKHLLTHTSGLPSSYNFSKKGYSLEQAIEEICFFPITEKPDVRVIYSDLNFILLGFLVQQVSGLGLDEFSSKYIFEPLEMKEAGFKPSVGKKDRIAATEYRDYLNDYQWGTVHDENAEVFGGVSGHAGLFSTVQDLSRYAQCLLNHGTYGNQAIFSPLTIELMIRNFTEGMGLNRGLGWQLPDLDYSPAGDLFPKTGFGHTGFTGTSFWIDRERQLAVILLTNRVHFGRKDHILRIRRIFHNIVLSSLKK